MLPSREIASMVNPDCICSGMYKLNKILEKKYKHLNPGLDQLIIKEGKAQVSQPTAKLISESFRHLLPPRLQSHNYPFLPRKEIGEYLPSRLLRSPLNFEFSQQLWYQFAQLHDRDVPSNTRAGAVPELSIRVYKHFIAKPKGVQKNELRKSTDSWPSTAPQSSRANALAETLLHHRRRHLCCSARRRDLRQPLSLLEG